MLKYSVKNQIIERLDDFRVVADSKNYLTADFVLSEEWNNNKVFASFSHITLGLAKEVEVVNGKCFVPWEVIKPPFFSVSLFCGDLITSNAISVHVEASGLINGEPAGKPSPTIWEEFVTREELENKDYAKKTEIPTKTSELENDSKFIAVEEAPVQSVNGKSGAVQITASDIGLGNVDNTADNEKHVLSAEKDGQGNIISISCGYGVSADVDPQTYVCTFNLLNANGDVIGTSTIDLPLESMVVSGEYNAETKKVVLTLKSGDTVEFSIADLISGLVSQSDIVNSLDSTETTKPLSAAQGKVLNDSKADKTELPTKVSQLTNDAGYLTEHQDISGKADKTNITNSTETTVSTELSDNTELIYGEVSSISVTFPASVGLDYTSSIIFTTPATLPENYTTFPSDVYFKGDECDGGIFIPNASTRYTMLFYYDGTQIIGLVSGIEVTA